MAEQQEWYRNYSAHIRGEPQHIMAIEKMISRLINTKNINRDGAITQIFISGITTLLADENSVDDKTKRALTVANAIMESRADKNTDASLRTLYGEKGVDWFIKWCAENEIDPNPTIDLFEESNDVPVVKNDSQKQRTLNWLTMFLRDGCPHQVIEIIKQAVVEGILPNPVLNEKEYEKAERSLRSLASSVGFSGNCERGCWKLNGI